MLYIIIKYIIFGLGLLCLHVDIGSRLFGSYARTPLGMLWRMFIVIFFEIIYSLPLLAIIAIPDSNVEAVLNILIFVF